MIDPSMRLERIAADAADSSCAAILLDVVLGHVADPDPAGTLAPALRAVDKPVIVSLIGTESDPQQWSRTARALADADVEVYLSNAQPPSAQPTSPPKGPAHDRSTVYVFVR